MMMCTISAIHLSALVLYYTIIIVIYLNDCLGMLFADFIQPVGKIRNKDGGVTKLLGQKKLVN